MADVMETIDMRTIKMKIRGVAPLLHHNCRLADPLDEYGREMKKITAKRKKTDEDREALAKLEFLGGLYLGENGKPVIPASHIEGAIIGGAKSEKSGQDALSGVQVVDDCPIDYEGPKDPEKMWADSRFRDYRPAGIQKARVMRTRPRFNNWSADVEIQYNATITNEADVIRWLVIGGQRKGIGDFRPRHGRFEVLPV